MQHERRVLRTRWPRRALIAAVLWQAVVAANDSAPRLDEPELQRCAERNLPRQTLVQTQHVAVISEDGWTRNSRRRVYWKRLGEGSAATLIEVEAPVAEAGLKLLVRREPGREPELYVYTPDSGKARRMIGGGGSNTILGTDFTFEDARHFEAFLAGGNTRRRPDERYDDRPVFVIETRPDANRSDYGRIVTRVDQRACLPLETRFFGRNGERAKTLVIDPADILARDGIHLPTAMTMHNHRDRSRTEFALSDIKTDVELRDSLFTLANLRQAR